MTHFFETYSTPIIAVIIASEIIITLLTVFYYISTRKKTRYSYKNASLLGGSLFLVIMTIFSISMLFADNNGFVLSLLFIYNISQITQYFPFFLLPLMFLFFAFMSISNISLIRHEGKRIKNVVGAVLGFFLIAATIAGVFGWDIVYENIIFSFYAKGARWITIFDIAIPEFLTGLICYLECLLFGTVVSALAAARHIPEYDKDYAVILGCAISKDGKPLPLLRGRVDRALEFGKEQFDRTGKKIRFVTSGGQGNDECISEAESMKNYLISCGVDENDIITEDKSTNTLENMKFSKEKIAEDGRGDKIIFSTTNYHVFRSGIYSEKAGLGAEGIGSRTKWYFWPNAFAREFIALLASNKKGHIINALVILLLSFVSGYVSYLL